MRPRATDKTLDYFPILAFFLFWFLSSLTGAIQIGDPALLKLGIITLPSVAAIVYCTLKIRNSRKKDSLDKDSP